MSHNACVSTEMLLNAWLAKPIIMYPRACGWKLDGSDGLDGSDHVPAGARAGGKA